MLAETRVRFLDLLSYFPRLLEYLGGMLDGFFVLDGDFSCGLGRRRHCHMVCGTVRYRRGRREGFGEYMDGYIGCLTSSLCARWQCDGGGQPSRG